MNCATYSLNCLVFITVEECVYSAVRTDSLYKADYSLSLKDKTEQRSRECARRNALYRHFADFDPLTLSLFLVKTKRVFETRLITLYQ